MGAIWDTLVASFTWERFLVLWGLITPAVAWIATRRWERKNQRAAWDNERAMWQERVRVEEERAKQDRERARVEGMREQMRKTYTGFLTGASAMEAVSNINSESDRKTAYRSALPEFSQRFQESLLCASAETAAAAVTLWNEARKLATVFGAGPSEAEVKSPYRKARRSFVIEARADVEDPDGRTAHPGVKIEPALKIGGFSLEDAG